MLALVSTEVCTRCGRALEDGLCPVGHPQRAARRRRRPWRTVFLILLLLGILGGAAYGGLTYYPPTAAEDAIRPVSERFSAALPPLRATIDAFPEAGDEAALGEASAVVTAADEARELLLTLQARLEETSITSIPVLSDRPALRAAEATLAEAETFTTDGLDLVGDLEAGARYLIEISGILPVLENLREAVGNPRRPGQVEDAVAAALPIADQLRADLRSLTPPDELASSHAALLAIARSLRATIRDLGETAGTAATPVVRALVRDIRGQIDTFQETAAVAPDDARDAGLRERTEAVEGRAERIIALLRELRSLGADGLTIPEA